MTPSQAQRFDANWRVLGQQDLWDGFSAVLLQPVDSAGQASGQKVLAIRGSESSHLFVDYLANTINIALLGTNAAMRQYQSLEDFYQLLIGQGKVEAGESIVVTGHSLGGFLAQAFAAKHDNRVSAAYTFNSPGFSVAPGFIPNTGTQLLEFFGIVDATIPNNKIFNLRALDGLSATAGLGQMVGSVEGVRIEPGGVIHDHSIATLTDALAIQEAVSALDPTQTLLTVSPIFTAAGPASSRIEGLLDGLRRQLVGISSVPTPIDDRLALYKNLYALAEEQLGGGAFRKLAGNVNVSDVSALGAERRIALAKMDFGDFMALATLSPFSLHAAANVASAQRTLDTTWQSVQANELERWTADKNIRLNGDTSKELEFSDQWYSDRAAMLDWDIKRNLANMVTARGYSARELSIRGHRHWANRLMLLALFRPAAMYRPEIILFRSCLVAMSEMLSAAEMRP